MILSTLNLEHLPNRSTRRNMDPLITTVIPTFRRPDLLTRAIESALAQSFTSLRVCVFDNASGDETESVVAALIRRDKRVSYIKNPTNIGAVKNMMRATAAVTTEFYSILNDDDFLLPGFYKNAMSGFQTSPTARFACAKTITIDLTNNKLQLRNADWVPGVYAPTREIATKMYRSHFTQTGVLFRREMRDVVGLYENSGNDLLYMTMAAASSPFLVLDCYGGAFIIHAQSYTSKGGISQERLAHLYEALIATIDTIVKMQIPADAKVHLIGLVENYYYGIFDVKQLGDMSGPRRPANDQEQSLPSRVTFAGILRKISERYPPDNHPLIGYSINWLLARWERAALKASRAGWVSLPSKALDALNADGGSANFAAFAANLERRTKNMNSITGNLV